MSSDKNNRMASELIEVAVPIQVKGSDNRPSRIDTIFVTTANDLLRLREFQEEAERVAAYPAFQRGLSVSQHISGDVHHGMKFEMRPPEETQIDSALHRARPFLLQDESVYFFRVLNVVKRGFRDSDEAQALLLSIKKKFECTDDERDVLTSKSGEVLNSDKYFRLWINVREYHRDSDKRKELATAFANDLGAFVDSIFYSVFINKMKAVFRLKDIVNVLLDSIGDKPLRETREEG